VSGAVADLVECLAHQKCAAAYKMGRSRYRLRPSCWKIPAPGPHGGRFDRHFRVYERRTVYTARPSRMYTVVAHIRRGLLDKDLSEQFKMVPRREQILHLDPEFPTPPAMQVHGRSQGFTQLLLRSDLDLCFLGSNRGERRLFFDSTALFSLQHRLSMPRFALDRPSRCKPYGR
jgi:hypothetical protein